jgi:CrcB protein
MRPAAGPGWQAWTAVALGALVGTVLRYGLGLAFPDEPATVPWTTLSINASRSFILTTVTTLWMARPKTAFG